MARYIGKRIVPKHCGYWDNAKEYEMESVVYHQASGNSYISRKTVPAGTDISQTEYWALCSDFNMQMDLLEKHFTATEQRIVADNDAMEQAIRQNNAATAQAIQENNAATAQTVQEDNTATRQHVDESLEETTTELTQTVTAAQTAMTRQKESFDATAQQLNARMDEVLVAGTGDGQTEIADARVDADGNAFDSLGSHIRSASERSNSALNSRLNFLVLEQGSITAIGTNAGKETDAANRVRTVTKIEYPVHIDLSNTDYLVNTYNVYNKTTGAFIPPAVSPQGNSQKIIDIVPESGTYVRITFKHANGNDFTPGDLQPDLTLCNFETRIKSLETQTDNLQNQTDGIQAVVSTNDNVIFTTGYFIDTSQGNVGSVVDVTPISNAFTAYFISQCKTGDVFTITGTGGSSARLWCFLDRDYRRLSGKTAVANASATDLQLIADQPGYFICNVLIANPYSVVKTTVGDMTFDDIKDTFSQIDSELDAINGKLDNVTHITNPHYLFWRMGAFDSNGAQGFSNGMLSADRFFTVVKLKAGSTVSKKSSVTRGTNLAFGYKLSESDAILSGYQSSISGALTIAQDCIAYIGIRYNNPVEALLNDSILDAFDFDLKVIDYSSRYSRGDRTIDIFAPATSTKHQRNYGHPCPEIYYEGQHTDDTGWTNSTSDIGAIYDAFDALAEDSGGYFGKKTDYGVAYTGNAGNPLYEATDEWHMYSYSTAELSTNSVPKVAITCCMHGNEKMSVYAMHYLIYDLIHNATKNPVLSWLKSNCIITFIPICNPYGFMKATPSRLNENGVNLNRNFPTYNWGAWEDDRTDGNGSQPGGMNYKGEAAASETQTKLMMRFFRNNYDAVLAIDIHTNGADTVARDQISAYMPADPQSTTDLNYDLLHDFIKVGKCFNTRLKPWLNEKYGAGMPYSLGYGSVIAMPYYPCAPHWIRETAGLIGQCYEVMAGSSTGFIGDQLTVYAPATIKAAAEEIGNLLVTLLAHCKGMD